MNQANPVVESAVRATGESPGDSIIPPTADSTPYEDDDDEILEASLSVRAFERILSCLSDDHAARRVGLSALGQVAGAGELGVVGAMPAAGP